MNARLLHLLALATSFLIAGCATTTNNTSDERTDRYLAAVKEASSRSTPSAGTIKLADKLQREDTAALKSATEAARTSHSGTGVLVKPATPTPAAAQPGQPSEEVSLNYEGADLREVVRTVLGDILGEGYIIDPQVTGTVNIRTTRGIPRSALVATLETLCRMNGAALVKEGGVYKVLPAAAVVRGSLTPQLGGGTQPLPPGFNVILVPLKYIGVAEMVHVLEPFVKDANSIRPDPLRNMLVLSGTERELRHLIETIDMFDIDWLAGMSVGLFTLKSADVKTVYSEIEKILGDKNTGPLAGLLRITPIERMNALLVISPQAHYVEQAKLWIERLDKGGDEAGTQLFVYNVQNGRAEKLAPLIQQAFTGRATQQAATPSRNPQVAPGLTPGSIFSQPTYIQQQQPLQPAPAPVPATPAPVVAPTTPGAPGGAGIATGVSRNVQIIADKDNNAILVMSTPAEYALIESALKKLDVAQKQVLVEVTVAEVALSGEFSFGVEWYFTHGPRRGGGLTDNAYNSQNFFNQSGTTTSPLQAFTAGPGFSFLWQNSTFPGGIQAVLNMLDTSSKAKVVSNPHVMAVDNTAAKIQIGDRIPIQTSTVVGGTSNVTQNTSQYLDTGLTLSVTPRINEGGLVAMDLAVEYSNPLPQSLAQQNAGLGPPVTSRSVQTTVLVQSNETILMGGLIKETGTTGTSGIPVLSHIPIIGSLFGSQDYVNSRTELLLIITPRVIANNQQMRNITLELRKKMQNLDESVLPSPKQREDLKLDPAPAKVP